MALYGVECAEPSGHLMRELQSAIEIFCHFTQGGLEVCYFSASQVIFAHLPPSNDSDCGRRLAILGEGRKEALLGSRLQAHFCCEGQTLPSV